MRLRHARPGTETRYSGELVAEGDGWKQYANSGYRHNTPPYCVYPWRECPWCRGKGVEPSKPNPVAGMRVHFDATGWITGKSAIADGKEEHGV